MKGHDQQSMKTYFVDPMENLVVEINSLNVNNVIFH